MRRTQVVCRSGVAPILLTAMIIAAGGCNKKNAPAEIFSLEGKITKIKRTTDAAGEITVEFFSEKQREKVSGVASVTEETEILLDGAAAKLKDIQEGERVRGQVRVEKKRGQKVNVVLKIQVERPKPDSGG